MAKSTKLDKVQLEVLINGDRAGKTLADLEKAQRQLSAELKSGPAIGSEAYNKLQHELQQVTKQVNQTKAEIKGVGDQMSHSKQVAMELAGAFGIAFGIEKVIEFGKESIHAYMEAEESAHQLELTLTNISHEGVDAFRKMVDLAGRLSQQSIFSDEEIQNSEKMLLTMGLTSDQVEKLVPKILDYASVNNIDLKQATENAIRALEGKTKSLALTGDQFKDTGTQLGNYNVLLEKFSDKYAGDAAAALDTVAGKTKWLANMFNEAQEAVGDFFVTTTFAFADFIKKMANPELYDMERKVKKAFKDVEQETKRTREAIKEELKGMTEDQLNQQIVLNKGLLLSQAEGKTKLKKAEQRAAKETIKIAEDMLAEIMQKNEAAAEESLKKIKANVKKIEKIIISELKPKDINIIDKPAVDKQFNYIPEKIQEITTNMEGFLKGTQPRIDELLSASADNFLQRNGEKVQAVSEMFNQLATLSKGNAEAEKAVATGQALVQTFLGAATAIARADLFPFNFALAATITAAGLANVAKINGVGFAEGGSTGRPSFAKGGPVKKPFVAMAGEAGPEWIAPNWMIESPKLAPVFDILENIRTSKTFAAGGPTTSTSTAKPSFTPSTNTGGSTNERLAAAIDRLNANLEGGIAAIFSHDYYQKSTARIEAAKNSAFIAKS